MHRDPSRPLASASGIHLEIRRGGAPVFAASTTLAEMKRDLQTLVTYLYKETSFPHGCVLLTGTGVVPPDDFTLQSGDDIAITMDEVGTLRNTVPSRGPARLGSDPTSPSAGAIGADPKPRIGIQIGV